MEKSGPEITFVSIDHLNLANLYQLIYLGLEIVEFYKNIYVNSLIIIKKRNANNLQQFL